MLNELNPNIKFTKETSERKIPFLEVLVEKKGNEISTDIYFKPTDTQQYLHFGSCHPRHTKRSIPYNLARRICTIVSDDDTKIQRLEELKNYLLSRLNPQQIIENGIQKALQIERTELLNPPRHENAETNILPLVTTHNP